MPSAASTTTATATSVLATATTTIPVVVTFLVRNLSQWPATDDNDEHPLLWGQLTDVKRDQLYDELLNDIGLFQHCVSHGKILTDGGTYQHRRAEIISNRPSEQPRVKYFGNIVVPHDSRLAHSRSKLAADIASTFAHYEWSADETAELIGIEFPVRETM